MLETLKQKVYEANMLLPAHHLITFTWGNVSGIDREKGLMVIKPSGVEYDAMKPEDMVVVDLDGNKVEGDLNPSSDTDTHLEFYRNFKEIVELYIPILAGRLFGRRRGVVSRLTAQHREIIFTERFPVRVQ